MSVGASENSVKSWPTQKPRPAPVTTTARTSSDCASLSPAWNALCIAPLNAFSTSGRLSVSVSTAPSRLTSTSVMGGSRYRRRAASVAAVAPRIVRRTERALLGAAMAMIAFFLERRIAKMLKKT